MLRILYSLSMAYTVSGRTACNKQDNDKEVPPALREAYRTLCTAKRSNSAHCGHSAPLHDDMAQSFTRNELGEVVYFVGDVHGNLAPLRAMLRHIDAQPETSTVIFVGDIVNKGENSHEVVDLIRRRAESSKDYKKVLYVRGNHEGKVLAKLVTDGPFKANKKFPFLSGFSLEDVLFMHNAPVIISLPWLSMRVVHAGLRPPPREVFDDDDVIKHYCDFTNMRYLKREGTFDVDDFDGRYYADYTAYGVSKLVGAEEAQFHGIWEDQFDGTGPWAIIWDGLSNDIGKMSRFPNGGYRDESLAESENDVPIEPMVIFGHDARMGFQAYNWLAVGLDTGCTYGRKLSMMRMDAENRDDVTIFQVDCGAEGVLHDQNDNPVEVLSEVVNVGRSPDTGRYTDPNQASKIRNLKGESRQKSYYKLREEFDTGNGYHFDELMQYGSETLVDDSEL